MRKAVIWAQCVSIKASQSRQIEDSMLANDYLTQNVDTNLSLIVDAVKNGEKSNLEPTLKYFMKILAYSLLNSLIKKKKIKIIWYTRFYTVGKTISFEKK